MDVNSLNKRYSDLEPKARLKQLFKDFDRVLVTSSFGTTSSIFLHLLHQVRPHHPIHFINTKYLFKETHAYRKELENRWNLNVVEVLPKRNENTFTALNYTWSKDPDACCHFNKVMPLDDLKSKHKVWISGMIGGTNENRKGKEIFRQSGDILRFYPLIDMGAQEAEWYKLMYELPQHPLKEKGFGSVGCEQCTIRGEGREGRWAGKEKTECGLHMLEQKQVLK
ncbi:MAG: phosphoadenylyl-sulfate reductase [Bacteroidota bacterium]